MRRTARALAFLAFATTSALASSPTVWEHPARPAPPGGGPSSIVSPRDGARADGVSIGQTGDLTLSAPLREIFPGGSKTAAP